MAEVVEMRITREMIEKSVEAALTKIRSFNPGEPLPIPVGPDLPVIEHLEVIDHDDMDEYLIRYESIYKGSGLYIAMLCEGIEFLYDPEFWVEEQARLIKLHEGGSDGRDR